MAAGPANAIAVDRTTLDRCPAEPGAYTLAITLGAPLALTIPRFAGRRLGAGLYVYAGSAHGPGGLRARLGRHLKRQKARRWHVDHLTAVATDVHALAVLEARECDLLVHLLAGGGFSVPLPGFGASDCRTCPTHLLHWSPTATGETS